MKLFWATNFAWCCYWFAQWLPQYQTVPWTIAWVLLIYINAYSFAKEAQ